MTVADRTQAFGCKGPTLATLSSNRIARTMWTKVEDWQLHSLTRLATQDPDRVETALNTLYRQFPGLREELAIMAVDQEQLSVDDCARLLAIEVTEVEARLFAFRHRARFETAVIQDPGNKIARLADGKVAVWEVIREFRRLGSAERVRDAFPGLNEGDLASAFRYAQEHPIEIEKLISDYEALQTLRRSQYPFAK